MHKILHSPDHVSDCRRNTWTNHSLLTYDQGNWIIILFFIAVRNYLFRLKSNSAMPSVNCSTTQYPYNLFAAAKQTLILERVQALGGVSKAIPWSNDCLQCVYLLFMEKDDFLWARPEWTKIFARNIIVSVWLWMDEHKRLKYAAFRFKCSSAVVLFAIVFPLVYAPSILHRRNMKTWKLVHTNRNFMKTFFEPSDFAF